MAALYAEWTARLKAGGCRWVREWYSIRDGLRATMMKSFRHKGLKALYERDDPSGVKPDQVKRLRALLARLEASSCPDDMDLPGLRLHPLSGKKRAGFFAVNVSGNWRLLFRFDETGNAIDVDWVDCH
jgi:proteic killer suppression protein